MHTKFMNSTQKANLEKLWTPEEGVSIPQYVARLEAQLVNYAAADLRYAFKNGEHIVAGTLLGTLFIRVSKLAVAEYTIRNAGGMLYTGKRAGAVETLVNAYKVEACD